MSAGVRFCVMLHQLFGVTVWLGCAVWVSLFDSILIGLLTFVGSRACEVFNVSICDILVRLG